MYSYELRKTVEKIFLKLAKKNPKQLEMIQKIDEVVVDPHRYKNLRSPLQHLKRVHIDRHFVMTFSVDEKTLTVIIEDYDHHDNVYG
jgi:YafQ family addiction module toxin component